MNICFKKALILFSLLVIPPKVYAGFKFSGQGSTLQLSGSTASIILDTPLTNFNGTLKILNKSATSLKQSTTLDLLSFNNGIYQSSSSSKALLTGTIDPAATDKIILDSGQSLEVDNSSVIESVEIRNTGNSIIGQPLFGSAIVLKDASAELSLGIQNKLNQSITMNSGKVILTDDLTLQDGVFFSGNGTVDVNNKSLALPMALSSAWTGNLTFLNANDIALTGFTTLNGAWTFSGTGQTSRVNGNGNILDISGGGSLIVSADHTLYLTDIMIKGLGTNGGTITIDSTSVVKISATTLELDGSFNLAAGQILVQGNNSSLIAKNADTFNLTSADASFVVDGVVFSYDPLGSAPTSPSPIIASGGAVISLINDGVIRANATSTDGSSGSTVLSGTSEVISSNKILSSSSTIHVINTDVLTPKAVTLDGQGNYVQFNFSTGQFFIVDENVTLTLQNILLKDFDPALLDLQGAGATQAKIIFGNNAAISLDKDLTLSTSLSFAGNATILGGNNRITLPSASLITCDGTNNTLILKDLRIYLENNTAIACLDSTATIQIQNSSIFMNNAGFTFDTGNLSLSDNVVFDGADATSPTGTATFTFSSAGDLSVLSSSTMKICKGVIFSYNPDVTGDTAAEGKRHFVLNDPSSILWLDSAIVQTGTMGFALDYGRLLIDGHTLFNISSALDAEVEFGSALNVEIAPSGIIDIDGALKYTSTTYP